MSSIPSASRPKACEPCHARKVRCDATEVGVPCTRCVGKNRDDQCVLVKRPSKRHRRLTPSNFDNSSTRVRANTSDGEQRGVVSGTIREYHTVSSRDGPAEQHEQPGQGYYTTTSQLGTARTPSASVSDYPSHSWISQDSSRRFIIEPYRELNAFSIVGNATGALQNKGILKSSRSNHRDVRVLDSMSMDFLHKRNAFSTPGKATCQRLIEAFFHSVYIYQPILDLAHFLQQWEKGTVSVFLLYTIFIVTLPYMDDVPREGMPSGGIKEVQFEYFTRAKLIVDLGYECDELALLQGSIFLSSFQHYMDPIKDYRFWFANAVRSATLMGIHQQDIRAEADESTQKLFRRISEVLIQRDILFVLLGLQSLLSIDHYHNSSHISLEDFEELNSIETELNMMTLLSSPMQGAWLLQNSTTMGLGLELYRIFYEQNHPAATGSNSFQQAIKEWKDNYTKIASEISNAVSSDQKPSNVVSRYLLAHVLALYEWNRLRHSWGEEAHAQSTSNQNSWDTLLGTTSILRSGMMSDLTQNMPPIINDIVSQSFAIQIEMSLKSKFSPARLAIIISDMHLLLSYLEDAVDKWPGVDVFVKLFKQCLERRGTNRSEI